MVQDSVSDVRTTLQQQQFVSSVISVSAGVCEQQLALTLDASDTLLSVDCHEPREAFGTTDRRTVDMSATEMQEHIERIANQYPHIKVLTIESEQQQQRSEAGTPEFYLVAEQTSF